MQFLHTFISSGQCRVMSFNQVEVEFLLWCSGDHVLYAALYSSKARIARQTRTRHGRRGTYVILDALQLNVFSRPTPILAIVFYRILLPGICILAARKNNTTRNYTVSQKGSQTLLIVT